MLKTFSLALLGLLGTVAVEGQMKKQFTVDNQGNCLTVDLHLKAKTGNCIIRPSQTPELLNFYSNQELEEYAHTFSNEVRNAVCYVRLALEQGGTSRVSKKISYQVFGGGEKISQITSASPRSSRHNRGVGACADFERARRN